MRATDRNRYERDEKLDREAEAQLPQGYSMHYPIAYPWKETRDQPQSHNEPQENGRAVDRCHSEWLCRRGGRGRVLRCFEGKDTGEKVTPPKFVVAPACHSRFTENAVAAIGSRALRILAVDPQNVGAEL